MNDCPRTRPSNHFRTYVTTTPRPERRQPRDFEMAAWAPEEDDRPLWLTVAEVACWAFLGACCLLGVWLLFTFPG